MIQYFRTQRLNGELYLILLLLTCRSSVVLHAVMSRGMPELFGLNFSWLSIAVSTLLIFTMGVLCSTIVNRSQFLSVPSNMPAALFFIFSNFLPKSLSISYWHLVVMLLVLIFNKLFKAYLKQRPERHYFDTAFLLGLASILFIDYTFYFPGLLMSCFFLTNLKLRYWLLQIIAFLMPWSFYITFLYWTDNFTQLTKQLNEGAFIDINQLVNQGVNMPLSIILFSIVGCLGIIFWFFRRSSLEDMERPILSIATLFYFLSILMVIFLPEALQHVHYMLIFALVFINSFWIYELNSKLANVLFLLIITLAIIFPFIDQTLIKI